MWELDCEESWALKNWCFWTVVLEKTFENLLDSKEIKLVNAKGNQSWIFIGRTDAKAETPVLWPPDVKSWLIRKDLDAGKDWRQEENGMTEDEMFGWYHWLDGHEFEQALGGGEGQGSLVCCSPWGCKESDTAERLNNNNNRQVQQTKERKLLCREKEGLLWRKVYGREGCLGWWWLPTQWAEKVPICWACGLSQTRDVFLLGMQVMALLVGFVIHLKWCVWDCPLWLPLLNEVTVVQIHSVILF